MRVSSRRTTRPKRQASPTSAIGAQRARRSSAGQERAARVGGRREPGAGLSAVVGRRRLVRRRALGPAQPDPRGREHDRGDGERPDLRCHVSFAKPPKIQSNHGWSWKSSTPHCELKNAYGYQRLRRKSPESAAYDSRSGRAKASAREAGERDEHVPLVHARQQRVGEQADDGRADGEHTPLGGAALDRSMHAPQHQDDAAANSSMPKCSAEIPAIVMTWSPVESFRQNPIAPQRLNAFALVTG